MGFTKGRKVRITGSYHGIPLGTVAEFVMLSPRNDAYSWVRFPDGESLVQTAQLTPAEPVTTPEEAARYERVERVLDAAQESMKAAGLLAPWFAVVPRQADYHERSILAALLLDLMERGEL